MRFLSVNTALLMGLALTHFLGAAQADEATTAAGAAETIELTFAAAPEPRPALKYRLFPGLAERTPGNAATYYYRALVQQKMRPPEYWQEYNNRSEAWLTKDAAEYPKAEVQKWLAAQQDVLSQLKTAVYRERCDWDLRVQDLRGIDVVSFYLAEFQECRTLARLVQLQAHDQIMSGRYDDALETLRLGYQLAHDAGKPPFLVGGLIGIAISQLMNSELTLLIEKSDRNYYWAIASLPHPLVDLQPALEMEVNLPAQMFPFLKDAETAERSPDEWRRLLIDCLHDVAQLESSNRSHAGWQDDLIAVMVMAKLYPAAKEQLVAEGMSRERVAMMPVGQVVAIQTARATEYAYHELFKLSLLPRDEAIRLLPQVMKNLEQDYIRPPATLSAKAGLPLAALLLPGLQAVYQADVRAARSFAALQTIEAIRMHAAASGKLPASLSEIKVVPIPNDPLTTKPLPYTFDSAAGVATLDVPPIEGQAARHSGKHYVLRLRAK